MLVNSTSSVRTRSAHSQWQQVIVAYYHSEGYAWCQANWSETIFYKIINTTRTTETHTSMFTDRLDRCKTNSARYPHARSTRYWHGSVTNYSSPFLEAHRCEVSSPVIQCGRFLDEFKYLQSSMQSVLSTCHYSALAEVTSKCLESVFCDIKNYGCQNGRAPGMASLATHAAMASMARRPFLSSLMRISVSFSDFHPPSTLVYPSGS